MLKNFFQFIILFSITLFTIDCYAQNHGATITWNDSQSVATCNATPGCTYGYTLFEGASKNETTALLSNSKLLTFTDDGPTTNAYLGTTRCYFIRYTQTINSFTLSADSQESCATWPSSVLAPSVVITLH